MAAIDPNAFTEVSIPVPWGHIAGRWYGAEGRAGVRPMLALHGWQDNCGTFAPLAPLLAQHTSLLCIDFPGHGRSSHLPAGMSYNSMDYVNAILHVMRVYGWKRVSLLAHSKGSAMAWFFAAIFPQRVNMIISIDVIMLHAAEPHVGPLALNYCVERLIVDSEWRAKVEPPSYTFTECERLLHEGSKKSVDLAQCHHLLERNLVPSRLLPAHFYFARDYRVKHEMFDIYNKRQKEQLAQRICAVPIPYLLVCGGSSTDLSAALLPESKELLEQLTTTNPHFELHVVAGGTHHVHLNMAPTVAEIIIPFLQKYSPLETPAQPQPKAKI